MRLAKSVVGADSVPADPVASMKNEGETFCLRPRACNSIQDCRLVVPVVVVVMSAVTVMTMMAVPVKVSELIALVGGSVDRRRGIVGRRIVAGRDSESRRINSPESTVKVMMVMSMPVMMRRMMTAVVVASGLHRLRCHDETHHRDQAGCE